MKNLLNDKNLLNLATKESMIHKHRKCFDRDHDGVFHKVDGVYPYIRARRILEANVGKQFSKVFRKYCKQVPVYQQTFFLEEFEEGRWPNDFYVDKVGNIQKQKKKKVDKSVFFYSDDYETSLLHKTLHVPLPDFFWLYERKNGYKGIKYNIDDFVYFITSGYEIKFSSKNDPKYKRLIADQNKSQRAFDRKNKKEKVYSFLTREEEKAIADKAENRRNIESHGFDYLTSFRNEKCIHPDIIKENQGF